MTGGLQSVAGYAIATVVVAWQTYKKYTSEQRGESREIERLVNALADERGVNAELRLQRDDAWAARDKANDRNNEMFRELADLKASNARLELQVSYLAEQINFLKSRLNEQR